MSTESLMPMAKVEQRGPLLGKLEEFSSNHESNFIAEDKKLCTLLTSIGTNTHTLLRNVCVPEKLAVLTYTEAVALILSGVKSDRICQKLLAEEYLTYDRALKLATSIERPLAESVEWRRGYRRVQHSPQHSTTAKEHASQKPVCFCCGKENHTRAECKYRSYKCNRNKCGHLQVVCKSASVQFLINNDDSQVGLSLFQMHKKGVHLSDHQYTCTLLVEGVWFEMEIDTGSVTYFSCSLHAISAGISSVSTQKYISGTRHLPRLGTYTKGTATLHVKQDVKPQYKKARALLFSLKTKVEQELDRLVKVWVLKPVEFNEWATPIVPIIKKDGTVRICGDYNITVNPVLETDLYPMPRIEDILNSFGKCDKFSKFYLNQAYQQVLLDENSRKYVTISTHKGLFQYSRIPVGVSYGPGIFQRLMEQLLVDIVSVLFFLDDILVTADNDEKHLERLTKVHGNADALSQLPLSQGISEPLPGAIDDGDATYWQYIGEGTPPVTNGTIHYETKMDTLTKVIRYILYGWPKEVHDNTEPFWRLRDQLTLESGILMWGYRVIIPDSCRAELLQKLRGSHIGTVKMSRWLGRILVTIYGQEN
ncbi:hypothetical protein PR048_028366 [Dryococelus australis]|uniref:Reverse transcriptase domain-containing protein n=1 Tax=Dryococelus australis TaxID=614101 RepID=A0ABQ9GJ45_9NEOP|nr:hypothetical protein PR048_028366 [Dryococelus australis]